MIWVGCVHRNIFKKCLEISKVKYKTVDCDYTTSINIFLGKKRSLNRYLVHKSHRLKQNSWLRLCSKYQQITPDLLNWVYGLKSGFHFWGGGGGCLTIDEVIFFGDWGTWDSNFRSLGWVLQAKFFNFQDWRMGLSQQQKIDSHTTSQWQLHHFSDLSQCWEVSDFHFLGP